MRSYGVSYAAVLLVLWDFTSMKKLAASLCEEELHNDGTANVKLTLMCNTSHLLSNVQIAMEQTSLFYSFSLGINCLDINGSQSFELDIWDHEHILNGEFSLVHTPTLHPGLECVLFGCYDSFLSEHTFAIHPSHCVIDEDECFRQTHNCSDWANCTNTVGSYKCSCWYGYDGDGFNCSDINECDTGGHDCSEYALCTNTPGGYNCSCLNGYDGDGVNCTDENECLMQTHTCSDGANCTNTVGSYNCSCWYGFDGDGFNCSDINECDTGGHDCSEYALCINTPGGYNCSCLNGHDGDGVNCTDVDECLMNAKICGVNATCVNVIGSYTCTCDEGYVYSQNECIAYIGIDECSQGMANCSLHARCIDTEQGYLCECTETYEGDGFSCTASITPHSMTAVTFVVVPVSLVLLCLIVSFAALIVCIFNSQKKQSWLHHLKGNWGNQEVDKDFTPVNLTFVVSSSVQSIIEPLQIEYKQTVVYTSDLAGQSNSECETQSSSSSTIMTPRDKHDSDHKEQDTCCAKADEFLPPQNSTCDITKQNDCTVHTCHSQTSVFQLEDVNISDSQFAKDESGFMSDTSSSVYLSFYKLSNKQ